MVTALVAADPLLTRDEVAKWLKLESRQVERLGVPYVRLGPRTVRYLKSDVEAWLQRCRVAA